MCQNCDALRREFAEDILRRRLRLSAGEARVVKRMYVDGLEPLEPETEGATRVLIGRIRQAIGFASVQTVRHRGYQLTTAGVQLVERALRLEELAA